LPDFGLLGKQREYVRWALTAYLYLAQVIKEKKTEYDSIESVIRLLERSIIDIGLREKMLEDAQTVFDLLPHKEK